MIEYKNPSLENYHKMETVFLPDKKTPLANIFISYTDKKPSFGTIFGVHGFGGSPIDHVIKSVKNKAMDFGFNFVAVESFMLSSTSRDIVPDSDTNFMTMDIFRKSIHSGLKKALFNKELNSGYNIVWAHCLGGRAIIDNYMSSAKGNKLFDEYVLVAPYFLPEIKILSARKRMLTRDPSGKTWWRFLNKVFHEDFNYNGKMYTFPKSGKLFDTILQKLPEIEINEDETINCEKYISDLFNNSDFKFTDSFRTKLCTCILAEKDHIIDYTNTEIFYNLLPIETKSLIKINGTNHEFDKKPEKYDFAIETILNRSKEFILEKNMLIKSKTFNMNI